MANKPKTKVVSKEGTKVHRILTILTQEKDFPTFDNYTEAVDYLNQHYAEDISIDQFKKTIRWYNEGLYEVNGLDVFKTGAYIRVTYPTQSKENAPNNQSELYQKSTSEEPSEDVLAVFEERCKKLGISPKDASGSFLKFGDMTLRVPNSGIKDNSELEEHVSEVKQKLKDDDFFSVNTVQTTKDGRIVGVVNITDLHIGAFVRGLIKTPDFDTEILKRRLEEAVVYINRLRFDTVRVNILGDVIHSVTGTNHPNTFKECEQGMFGPNVIKMAVEILHEKFLSKINNLGKINQIGGNHGRLEQSAQADAKAGGEDLVAYCLGLLGYDIEFNALLISEEIDGIQYVLLHGDKGVSRRPTKDIIFDYGQQGIFNFLLSGHLHSRISRMTAKSIDKYEMVTDDSIDCRAQTLPSLYSGDSYSDDNNWFSCCGFMICYNNGSGKPITIDIPLD